MNTQLRRLIQVSDLSRLNRNVRWVLVRNTYVKDYSWDVCQQVNDCLWAMISNLESSYLSMWTSKAEEDYMVLFGSFIFNAMYMFSDFEDFLRFVKDSPYRQNFLATFIDDFTWNVDDDFYFPTDQFDAEKLLSILIEEENKKTSFSIGNIEKVRNIILSCVKIPFQSLHDDIRLDHEWWVHETETCWTAEIEHWVCLEKQWRCIYVELNGQIIGHIKAKWEKSFLSYVDMKDMLWNVVLVKWWLYSIKGGYEIFLLQYDFDTLSNNSIYTVQFSSIECLFCRFSKFLRTDIYFERKVEELSSKKKISVNDLVKSHSYPFHDEDEIKYHQRNIKESGLI